MPCTRIKICGITRVEDVAAAVDSGVDSLGLNFIAGPRKLSLEQAERILDAIPPLVASVGLTSDDPAFFKAHTAADPKSSVKVFYKLHYYQLYHPQADGAITSTTPAPFWPVLSIAGRNFIDDLKRTLSACSRPPVAVLLDTASKDKLGGTGHSFNWHWIAEARDAGELEGLPPIILAGGLTPDNIADAIRIARPYAVDVSSGVEVRGKPGVKDPIKMRDFIHAAKGA